MEFFDDEKAEEDGEEWGGEVKPADDDESGGEEDVGDVNRPVLVRERQSVQVVLVKVVRHPLKQCHGNELATSSKRRQRFARKIGVSSTRDNATSARINPRRRGPGGSSEDCLAPRGWALLMDEVDFSGVDGRGGLFGRGFGMAGVSRADGAGDFGGAECAGGVERDEWCGVEDGDL